MTALLRPEILSSLNSVRADVQRQLASLDRYRALNAIDQTIADFPALEDVTCSLAEIRARVQKQLDETREYRALQAIDRIMPELSEVFALLEEKGSSDPADLSPAANVEDSDESAMEHDSAALPQVEPEPLVVEASEAEALVEAAEFAASEPHVSEGAAESPAPWNAPAVPSLADSVAQLMAQPIVPPPRDAHAAHQPTEEREAIPPHAERAA